MIIQKGKIINVQVYKHNGILHKQLNGVKILEDTKDFIVLFMYKTKVDELIGNNWVAREPIIWFFPKNQFYNTTALIRKTGIFFYTNLASTAVFEDNTLKFIDYDLDVKAYPGLNIKVVDKKDFEKNIVEYAYNENLINKIQSTTEDIIKSIKNKETFFNEKKVYEYVEELIKNKIMSWKTIQK